MVVGKGSRIPQMGVVEEEVVEVGSQSLRHR